MLDSLRKAAGTWVAKLLLLLLVGSFAVWGISGNITGGTGNSVLVAGNSSVSINEYRLAYDRQLNTISQQAGTRLTREQAQAFGLDQQVISQLTAGVVLDEQARQMNLGLSKDRIAILTAEDPAFKNAAGSFDREQFTRVLANAGMRPEDYIRNREQVAIRQQIVEAVGDGVAAPETLLKAFALYRGETRTVSYVTIPEAAAGPAPVPADADLKKFFDEKKPDYRAPEYRKISYMKLEADDIANTSAISTEDAKADYEKRIDRYTTAEKRAVEQLVFSSEDAAKTARAKIDAGTSFEDVVKADGKTMDDVKLGELTKDQMPDKTIADAAFALQANQVSTVVKGAFGSVLLRVTAITPQVVRGFAEVEAEIKKELALNEAKQQLFDVHDGVEDMLGGGAKLSEAATKYGLKVVTIDAIDQTARKPDGSVASDIPESQALLDAAFQTQEGVENLPINIGSGGYIWYVVEAITPARDRKLEEVRDKVVADWTAEKSAALLSIKAEELRKRLAGGSPLEAIASETGQTIEVKRGLKRGGEDPDFGDSGINAAFAGPRGYTGVAEAIAGKARILFRVDEVAEPIDGSTGISPNEKNAVSSGLSDDLLEQYVTRLQGTYPVTLNERAMQSALQF